MSNLSYDSNEILKNYLDDLSDDSLEKIQYYFDVDKYSKSISNARDLCGEYADFCSVCDKSLKHPCAAAYLKINKPAKVAAEDAVAEKSIRTIESLPASNNPTKNIIKENGRAKIRIAVAKRKK